MGDLGDLAAKYNFAFDNLIFITWPEFCAQNPLHCLGAITLVKGVKGKVLIVDHQKQSK